MSRRKLFSAPGAPLNATAFYILVSLSSRDRHGYEILKDVAQTSNGRISMGPAVLYTNLKRMLDGGLIVEVDGPVGVDERRRYYRLGRSGRLALAEETERMAQAVKVARARRPQPAS